MLDARLRFHDVVARIALSLRRYEQAANAYGRSLRLEPDHPDMEFHRAWCLVHVPRRRDEGIAAFQRLLDTSPSASGFFLMACALQQQGRHHAAVAAFQAAARLETFPTADFHMNLGISLSALGRWTEAKEAYGTAAHLGPEDAEAWHSLGVALVEGGRWRDAVPCFERAMRLSPNVNYATSLTSTLLEFGRLDEAQRLLRETLATNPTAETLKEMLAEVLVDQDRFEEALEVAEKVRRGNPRSPSARATLAAVLSRAGRTDEAIAEAEAAVALAPELAIGHFALASVRVHMKDPAAALAAFDRMADCIERSSDGSIVLRNKCQAGRGFALSLLGDHNGAMAAFKNVVLSDPTFFERHSDMATEYLLSLREAGQQEP